jgi:hypothetical protein
MILLLGNDLVACETFACLSIVHVLLDQLSFLGPPKPLQDLDPETHQPFF